MENTTVNQTFNTDETATLENTEGFVQMLFGSVGLFIFLENFGVFCLCIAKRELRTTVHSILVLNLSVSDFLIGLACVVWSSQVFVGLKMSGLICKTQNILAFTSVGTSQSQSLFICLDSFLCTYTNPRLRNIFQGKRIFVTLSLSYFISTVIATATVLSLSTSQNTSTCRLDEMYGNNIWTYHLISGIFAVPLFMLTIILYLLTMKRVRKRLRETDPKTGPLASVSMERVRTCKSKDIQQSSSSSETANTICSKVKHHMQNQSSDFAIEWRKEISYKDETKMQNTLNSQPNTAAAKDFNQSSDKGINSMDTKRNIMEGKRKREISNVSYNWINTVTNKYINKAKDNRIIQRHATFCEGQKYKKEQGSGFERRISDSKVNPTQSTFSSKALRASTVTITVIILTKVIFVGPFVITRPVEMFEDLGHLSDILFISLMLNSVANPFIYLCRIKAFRKVVLCCIN